MNENLQFGYTGNNNFLVNKAQYIQNNIYFISTLLGVIFIALGGDFAYDTKESKKAFEDGHQILAVIFNNWVLFTLGVFCSWYGLSGTSSDSKILKEENKILNAIKNQLSSSIEDNEKLHSKIQEKHQELVKNWLKIISIEVDLNTFERLTIYYEHNEEFTLLTRYSQNKNYDKIHNQKFPLNQGVISKSWEHNEYKEKEAPIHENDESEYNEYMVKKYKYTTEKLNSIGMKSDKYYGIAIQEADENIGVLLYEKVSQTSDKDFDDKCEKIQQHYIKYSSYLIKYVQDSLKLDRIQNIETIGNSVEDEVLSALGGER